MTDSEMILDGQMFANIEEIKEVWHTTSNIHGDMSLMKFSDKYGTHYILQIVGTATEFNVMVDLKDLEKLQKAKL